MAGRAFKLGEFTVDPPTGELRGPAGREFLDPKVMHVLLVLAASSGRIVRREELLRTVWPGVIVSDDALSRCVYQLRRHLGIAGGHSRYRALIETFPKRGYRLNFPAASGMGVADDSLEADSSSTRAPARRPMFRFFWIATTLAIGVGWGLRALVRSDFFWEDPFANARFVRLTDFGGTEQAAAISRDGSHVAFLSDRSGTFDVWAGPVGAGEFRNLTHGETQELRNPAVRTVDISPDASEVIFWTRVADSSPAIALVHRWAVPLAGGVVQPYLRGVAEVAWSSDGSRMAYHTTEPGDPLYVTEPNEKIGRQIFVAPPGLHCHFPVWSNDDAFVYFVYGRLPDETDIWRIASNGGVAERITFHDAHVSYPVLFDATTLLYLATAPDGSGPWLYGMDVDRRVSHRIDSGLQPFTSLAASADGRRLVATVTTRRTSLWRVPILGRVVERSDATRIDAPTASARSPRFGPGYLLYLTSGDGADRLWRLAEGTPDMLWEVRSGRVAGGIAVEPGGGRIALPVVDGASTRLYLIDPLESSAGALDLEFDVRGTPAWSPDGREIAVAGDRGSGPQLFRIPLDGGTPAPIVDEYSIDPAWSLDGRLLAYRGAESGPSFPLRTVTAAGERYTVPDLILPRGSRYSFISPRSSFADADLVVLKGELLRKNFWLVNGESGAERKLSDFGPQFVIEDFDVSEDATEIVFESAHDESDILLIDLSR